MHTPDVIILGAGASGLYCAIHAARCGLSVTVLDHSDKPARKVRVSGGGRCNFTNLEAGPDDYACSNPHFVKSALARHSPWDVVAFFAECGLSYEEKAAGQLFCEQKAGRLAGELVDRAKKAGAVILTGKTIGSVQGDGPFTVEFDGESITAPRLVVALGGPSWPQVGATDLGFRIAGDYGLGIVPPRPALVGFKLSGRERELCRSLAGTALPVCIRTRERSHCDDLLFTHKGISGPAPMQASLFWNGKESLEIDFLPTVSLADMIEEGRSAKGTLGKLLARYLPKRCVALIPEKLAAKPVAELSRTEVEKTCSQIHRRTMTPSGTEGWAKAEVAAGGIDTARISSKTMECRNVPGLHFIGEVLDVTGRLGGYNLHWAWASAHACAQALCEGTNQ